MMTACDRFILGERDDARTVWVGCGIVPARPSLMPKRVILCCDGTWNQPDQTAAGAPCPTNVVKFATLIPPIGPDGVEQRIFYHGGIGSTGSRFRRAIDGLTGRGISTVLKQCYAWLIRNYRPGDDIYIFGFSRGAYTARSLGGLVRNSGILRPENEDQLGTAFALYRSRDATTAPRAAASRLFRQSYAWSDSVPIKCIGVWDTVGALGVPNTMIQGILKHVFRVRREFHDTTLSSAIEYAFHAVAIDEARQPFLPTLWTQTAAGAATRQTLEQRWFAGCHADIGGGNRGTALSDVAFDWMVDRSRLAGLAIAPPGSIGPPEFPPHRPDPLGSVTPSMTPFIRLFFPSGKRTIRAPDATGETHEALAPPAIERWTRMPQWRPAAIVDFERRFPHDL